MNVYCYPTKGKQKAVDICQAFADGCRGVVVHDGRLRDGAAMFYGIDESIVHLWRQVRAERRPFFFVDNSYFDEARQAYFRVTRDALQHSGYGESSGARFAALGLEIKPWRTDGEHVVVCPQSEPFMRLVIGFDGDWLAETLATLKTVTKRPVRVREWNRDKAKLAATLQADLVGAYALVTHSSAAAVTALLAGVPVVSTGQESAAWRKGGDLYQFHALPRPARVGWAHVLADHQWTIQEMRQGVAWKALQ